MRGGENRKTEIQNEGGGGRIFIYVFIYYNLQRWSKGVGVLGCPSMPRLPLPRPCLAILAALTALHPNVRDIRLLLAEFTHSIIL